MADMTDIIKNFAQMMSSSSQQNEANNTEFSNQTTQTENADSQNTNSSDESSFPNIDMDTIIKIGQVMSAIQSSNNSNSANLLRSLKPYLKPSRQNKVDEYIQLLNLEQVMNVMNNLGGDHKHDS